MKSLKKLATMYAVAALGSALALPAFALNNDNKAVTQVDVQGGHLIIWVKQSLASLPNACSAYQAVSCSLSDATCLAAKDLAVAALLSGRLLDLNITGTCTGSFATVGRVRLK